MGFWGTGQIAHQQIDRPLTIHTANHPALQEARSRLVGRQTLPFGGCAGDLLEPPDRIFLVHGQRHQQDADLISHLRGARRRANRRGNRDLEHEVGVKLPRPARSARAPPAIAHSTTSFTVA
jgi:hypothetical protein